MIMTNVSTDYRIADSWTKSIEPFARLSNQIESNPPVCFPNNPQCICNSKTLQRVLHSNVKVSYSTYITVLIVCAAYVCAVYYLILCTCLICGDLISYHVCTYLYHITIRSIRFNHSVVIWIVRSSARICGSQCGRREWAQRRARRSRWMGRGSQAARPHPPRCPFAECRCPLLAARRPVLRVDRPTTCMKSLIWRQINVFWRKNAWGLSLN